jgi:hypothetical protein
MKLNRIIRIVSLTTFVVVSSTALSQSDTKAKKIHSIRKIIKSKEWYAEQAKLWKKETEQNPSNADAWYNYYRANEFAIKLGIPISSTSYILPLERIREDMQKAVPESFEYNLIHGWSLEKPEDQRRILEKAYEIKPDDPRIYYALITLYERAGQTDKMKDICNKLYKSRNCPSDLLEYNYNTLASIEKNGILFTNGDNDTYPVWMLQYAKNIRPDILLLNIPMSKDLTYLQKKMRTHGIRLNVDKFDIETLIRQIIQKAPHRKIYFANTVDMQQIKSLQENLYLTGLVHQYSDERFDNIALIKKHFEKKYRLDYLQYAWYTENPDSGEYPVARLKTNYIMPLLLLIDHYKLSDDGQHVDRWMSFVKRLAKSSGNPNIMKYLEHKYNMSVNDK